MSDTVLEIELNDRLIQEKIEKAKIQRALYQRRQINTAISVINEAVRTMLTNQPERFVKDKWIRFDTGYGGFNREALEHVRPMCINKGYDVEFNFKTKKMGLKYLGENE